MFKTRSYLIPTLSGLLCASLGCNGCEQKPSAPPIDLIGKDADLVVELRDLEALPKLRQGIAMNLSSVITAEQMRSIQDELRLSIGFDPTVPEGLQQAGLHSKGSVAVGLWAGRALWVVPVKDGTKFGQTLERVTKARFAIDDVKSEAAGGKQIKLLSTSFGPDKIPVLAYAVDRGLGVVGVGKGGLQLVKEALLRKPEDSVKNHPEYQAQVAALKGNFELRMISPAGNRALVSAIEAASRFRATRMLRQVSQHPELKKIKSVGWTINLLKNGFEAAGRARLTDEGLSVMKALFTKRDAMPKGVSAMGVGPAVLLAQVALDPQALLSLLAPPGSQSEQNFDRALGYIKKDVGADLKKELLPMLTGHAAVAVGVGDLKEISFRRLMGAPMSALWSAGALGVKDASLATALERTFDPGLEKRGFKVAERKLGQQNVRVVKRDFEGLPSDVLVETFGKSGAFVFSNEPIVTNEIAANNAGKDLLLGQSGLGLELSFGRLAQQLKSFNLSGIPMLFRPIAAKVIGSLGVLDKAELKVLQASDGLDLKARLLFSAPEKS